jgi:hypothetical protein
MTVLIVIACLVAAFVAVRIVRNFAPHEPVDESVLAGAFVELHRVRRRMELSIHRAQVRSDADRLRRELRDELDRVGGGR